MSRLLVSVRNTKEAQAALAGGADLIDIKEPTRGALGAADVAAWRAIQATVANRAPVSAALGELLDEGCLALAQQSAGMQMVKAGLAGCAAHCDWPRRLQQLRCALPPGVRLVAVIYADAASAHTPSPDEILAIAQQLELDTLLIDTFDKARGDLFQHLSLERLSSLVTSAKQANMQVALAGSLSLATIPSALTLAPEWIAVRGAACLGGERQTSIDSQCVSHLARLVH